MNTIEETKKVVVFVSKISIPSKIDEALKRVESRFKTLVSKRNQIDENLESERNLDEQDLEEQGRLIDLDMEMRDEQKKMVKLRDQLNEQRIVIIKDREAEINKYVPEEISW